MSRFFTHTNLKVSVHSRKGEYVLRLIKKPLLSRTFDKKYIISITQFGVQGYYKSTMARKTIMIFLAGYSLAARGCFAQPETCLWNAHHNHTIHHLLLSIVTVGRLKEISS
jgi:hypothetical protein